MVWLPVIYLSFAYRVSYSWKLRVYLGRGGKGERGKGKERRGKGGKGRGGKKPGGWIRYTIKIDIPLNHPAPLIILIDSKTRRGMAVLRKSIFIFFILFFLFSFFIFFFHATKIPYNDKSWLFDRGFPDRAVYFTYKVTRWITRTIFCLVAGVLYF